VIEHTLTNLVSSNEDLRNELDRQRPLLRATFVQRLLLGLHTSDVDAVDEAAELGVPTGNGTYTVAVVHVPGPSSVGSSQSPELPDILRIVVLDAIKTAIGQEVLYSTQSPEDTAVILLDVNHQTLSEGLSKVAERMTEEFGVRVVISVGADAQSLIEVSKSYQNAIDTRDYLLFTGRVGIGFYADVSQGSGRFLYPVEYELSLIRATESGNEEEVGRLFDSFLGRHIAGNQFSVHDTQQLFFDLRSTLMRIASAILGTSQESPAHADFAGIRERLENLDSHRSPEDLYPRIRELFLDLSRYVAEHQRSHNDALNERIRTYLIENFTDPTLNLAMIADTFKLTEQYVSAFFKEHNGVGYLEFVEELRLERARELLRDSGASVQQVAGEVGYANPNTFYKAFKRHFGQSPTTFRNQVSAKR
jgi:AraC-like DNA-binding protein